MSAASDGTDSASALLRSIGVEMTAGGPASGSPSGVGAAVALKTTLAAISALCAWPSNAVTRNAGAPVSLVDTNRTRPAATSPCVKLSIAAPGAATHSKRPLLTALTLNVRLAASLSGSLALSRVASSTTASPEARVSVAAVTVGASSTGFTVRRTVATFESAPAASRTR